jgi:hypothetical protein
MNRGFTLSLGKAITIVARRDERNRHRDTMRRDATTVIANEAVGESRTRHLKQGTGKKTRASANTSGSKFTAAEPLVTVETRSPRRKKNVSLPNHSSAGSPAGRMSDPSNDPTD